jgi:integrase
VAKEKLTETRISRARLDDGRAEMLMSDGDGLYLRVRRATDGRTVVRQWLFASKAGGTLRKIGLGGYDDVSLAEARSKAERLRVRRDEGGTPTAATADERLKTFGDLFEHHERVASPAAGRREIWDRWLAGRLDRLPLDRVTRAALTGALDAIRAEGRRRVAAGSRNDLQRTAGAAFGLVKQLTSFGHTRGILSVDPMAGAKRKDFGHQGIERDRILSPEEIAELSRRFATELRVGPKGREFNIPPLHPGAQAACWFLVATCARVGELAAMTPEQVDRERGAWTIPASVAKNGRQHVVHLSPFAVRMLDAMGKLPTAPGATNCGATLAKMLHGRQRPEREKKPGAKRAASSVLLLDGGPFTPHDLRRTGASLMQSLGVRMEVVEKCLNHTLPKLVKVYQRADLLDERRAAFDLLGARLAGLVDTTGVDRALERLNAP